MSILSSSGYDSDYQLPEGMVKTPQEVSFKAQERFAGRRQRLRKRFGYSSTLLANNKSDSLLTS